MHYEMNMKGDARYCYAGGDYRPMKQYEGDRGYKIIRLGDKMETVHQLMAITWLHHTPCGYTIVVDHINGIKRDNRLVNLRLVTHAFNVTSKNRDKISMFKNVYRDIYGMWCTSVMIGGKMFTRDEFNTETEALDAYYNLLDDNKTKGQKKKFTSYSKPFSRSPLLITYA